MPHSCADLRNQHKMYHSYILSILITAQWTTVKYRIEKGFIQALVKGANPFQVCQCTSALHADK